MNANKVALITGATGAIGKAIALRIAEKGYRTVITARSEAKARQIVREIIRSTGNRNVSYEMVDLSRRAAIQALADRWSGPLHVLINNAGTTPRSRLETPEGIELQFATNVLGYFWMMQTFEACLLNSSPARIVNVASYWAGGLDLSDLEFKRRRYTNGAAYRQSKQADRMLTVAFARRLEGQGVTVNACHPGEVNSRLSNSLGFGGHESPDLGAKTPVWLATGTLGGQVTGKYFEYLHEARCVFGEDKEKVAELYKICTQYE